jgi:lactate dehydrogenase-like 2-hydroxyacid dehydrogenase
MPRPVVFLARRIPHVIERELAERFDLRRDERDAPLHAGALAEAARTSDAIVPAVTDRITADVLGSEPRRLRIVANFGAGTDNIDLDAARQFGIVVTNTPGALTEDTTDIAMYLILAAMRRAGAAERELREGRWTGWRPTHVFGESLAGKTLGIVGYGRIGRAVARRARAFGMRVIYVTRSATADDPDARRAPSLEALLAESDVVSLHAPATPETTGMMDARRLALMRPSAVLVNTARGSLVDEQALADALVERRIAAAGLDVFESEPAVHPALLMLENVVLLPHIGSAARETREAMGGMVLESLIAFFEGREVPNRVT